MPTKKTCHKRFVSDEVPVEISKCVLSALHNLITNFSKKIIHLQTNSPYMHIYDQLHKHFT